MKSMATKEKDAKPAVKKAEKKEAKAEEKEAKRQSSSRTLTIAAIAVIVIAIIAVVFLLLPSTATGVSFSSFKSTFDNSGRISIVATYWNASQYPLMSPCYTSVIQVIAHSRKASTIDFYLIDSANKSCTYSKSGLGGSIVPITTNASTCLATAYSEPAFFLNYSTANSTMITANRMFVYGNSQYMSSCPVAVNLA